MFIMWPRMDESERSEYWSLGAWLINVSCIELENTFHPHCASVPFAHTLQVALSLHGLTAQALRFPFQGGA